MREIPPRPAEGEECLLTSPSIGLLADEEGASADVGIGDCDVPLWAASCSRFRSKRCMAPNCELARSIAAGKPQARPSNRRSNTRSLAIAMRKIDRFPI